MDDASVRKGAKGNKIDCPQRANEVIQMFKQHFPEIPAIEVAMLFAAYALKKGVHEAKDFSMKERYPLGNVYSLQKGAGDLGELAAFSLAYPDTPSMDEIITQKIPRLIDAGAMEFQPILESSHPNDKIAAAMAELVDT